jgi:hypothetical protein
VGRADQTTTPQPYQTTTPQPYQTTATQSYRRPPMVRTVAEIAQRANEPCRNFAHGSCYRSNCPFKHA